MSQQPRDVTSKKLETEANESLIKQEEYRIVTKNESNYFEQMKKMIISEGWTVQDHASLDLLQEMPNCLNFYIVRKSGNLLSDFWFLQRLIYRRYRVGSHVYLCDGLCRLWEFLHPSKRLPSRWIGRQVE